MSTVRRVCRNVKRWRRLNGMRWTAAAMQEAAKGFRRRSAQHATVRPLGTHRTKGQLTRRPLPAKPPPRNVNLGNDRFAMFKQKGGTSPLPGQTVRAWPLAIAPSKRVRSIESTDGDGHRCCKAHAMGQQRLASFHIEGLQQLLP